MTFKEIFHKGKRVDNGEWVTGRIYRLSERLNHFIMPANRGGISFEVDPETVELYTGYKDWFTGSIIKSEFDCAVGVIRFGEYKNTMNPAVGECHVGFYVEWSGDRGDLLRKDLGFWVKREYTKCIGNIHDNPELLEVD